MTKSVHNMPLHPRNAGFSLIEMMISMVLGLILLGGVVSVVINTNRSHQELNNLSRQIENGRYAVQVLREDIRHAGYYGEFFRLTAPAAVPLPCDAAVADLQTSMGLPIQGFSGNLDCLPNQIAGTDVLVIRRAATATTAPASLVANQIYIQSRPTGMVLDSSADPDDFNLTKRDGSKADIRRFLVHIYYLRNCSDCTGGGDGIPTLARAELSDNASTFTVRPLAEGIENLQLRYGVDTNEDGGADNIVTLPATADQWFNTVTVEINVLARSIDTFAGWTDNKTYTLGDVAIVEPGDQFKRQVFTAITRVVNPSSRREG